MKKQLFPLFLLFLSASAFGQSTAGPFVISSGSSACASIDVSGQSAVGISVTGTFSATLQPEVTIQGQAATNIQVTPSTSSTAQATITAAGNYTASVGGYSTFQVCITAYTSGTATIRLNTVKTTASNGGTGGGGGGGGASTFPVTGTSVDANDVGGGIVTLDSHGSSPGALGGSLKATEILFGADMGDIAGNITISESGFSTSILGGVGNPVYRMGNNGWHADPTQDNWVFGNASNDILAVIASNSASVPGPTIGGSDCYKISSSNNLTSTVGGGADGFLCRIGSGSWELGTTANSSNGDFEIGTLIAATSVTSALYKTNSDCAAIGSAASPSLVACAAAPSGSFSCATNASAATCVVSTTAVGTNSEVIVQESAAEGAKLGVTCNTAPTVTPAIILASKSNGVSFTINMPTITVNPACFVYWIVNK